eukprot:g19306.t1
MHNRYPPQAAYGQPAYGQQPQYGGPPAPGGQYGAPQPMQPPGGGRRRRREAVISMGQLAVGCKRPAGMGECRSQADTQAGTSRRGRREEETPSKLEFVTFDLSQSHDQCSVLASCDFSAQKFLSITWGAKDLDQTRFPYGLIAACHPEGVLNIYDPAVMISSHGGDKGLLWSSGTGGTMYTGCVAFHPNKPNVLAAGARGCEVQIFNLSDPTAPEVHTQSGQTKMQGEIVDLAWNRKVPNIISSTSSNGVNVIWDLKTRGTCAEIIDPSHRQHVANVQWSPDCATQLIVAYDDDRLPGFQIWDLRQPSYPFREINFGHSKGITKIAWAHDDPELLLSTGRDNRTICWVLGLGGNGQQRSEPEIFCDVSNVSNNTDISWAPMLKGFCSTSSMTNGFNLFSILNNQQRSRYMPKCYERDDCGGSFGFGGKIAHFGSAMKNGVVNLYVVPSEPEIIGSADAFENWANVQDWRGYCETKSRVEGDDYEKALWEFISLHIGADDITAKQKIVEKLGYNLTEIAGAAEAYLGHKPGSKWAEQARSKQSTAYGESAAVAAPALPAFDEQGAEDFFSSMAQKEAQKREEEVALVQKKQQEEKLAKAVSQGADWSQGPEALIRQTFLVGSREAAVEICLKCGRVADALLIAYPEPELFAKVRDEYIQKENDPFLSTIGNVVQNQLEAVVQQSNLDQWRETLALVATYADSDNAWRFLTEKLADRLEHEKFDVRSAVLCCVCSKNFGKTISFWSSMNNNVRSQNLALQSLVERMTIWQDVTGFAQEDPLFTMKLTQYAELLANSGRMTSAMRQLSRLKNDPSSALLRHRIFHSLPQEEVQKGQFQPGVMPFDQVQIKAGAYAGSGGGVQTGYGAGAGRGAGGKAGLPPSGAQQQPRMGQKPAGQPAMGGAMPPSTPASRPSGGVPMSGMAGGKPAASMPVSSMPTPEFFDMGAFGALDSLKEGATGRKGRKEYSDLGGKEFRAERREEDVESANYQLLNPEYREGPENKTNWDRRKNTAREGKLFAPEARVPIPRAEPVGRLRAKDETPWRQYTHGKDISHCKKSMRSYAVKNRFTPADIKGTVFDKVAPPPTRDGPVGSLSARDLIDPAAIPASVP